MNWWQYAFPAAALAALAQACTGGCSCKDDDRFYRTEEGEAEECHGADCEDSIEPADADGEPHDAAQDEYTEAEEEVTVLDCEARKPCLLSKEPDGNAAWGYSINGNLAVYIASKDVLDPWPTINRDIAVVDLRSFRMHYSPKECPDIRELPPSEYVHISEPAVYGNTVCYSCDYRYLVDHYGVFVDSRIAQVELNGRNSVFLPFTEVGVKDEIRLSEKYLVWAHHSEETNTDLFAYDRRTGEVITITAEPNRQGNCSIDGSRVVYDTNYYTASEIWLYSLDTRTAVQLTNDSFLQNNPSISGDHVVWMDTRDGEWFPSSETYTNSNIYLHTLSTGKTERLTDNPSWQETPRIDGDLVVWTDLRHGGRSPTFWYEEAEIYLMDLRTRKEYRVSNMPGNDYWPQISGTGVIWLHETEPGNRWADDLYYMDVAHLLEEPPDGG